MARRKSSKGTPCPCLASPSGPPAAMDCITKPAPSNDDVRQSPFYIDSATVHCSRTGLEWIVSGNDYDPPRAPQWCWRLDARSADRYMELFRAGKLQQRPGLVAGVLLQAGRSDLAEAICRDLLARDSSFVDTSDAQSLLLPILESREAWAEILAIADRAPRSFLLRQRSRALIALGRGSEAVAPLIAETVLQLGFLSQSHRPPAIWTNDTATEVLLLQVAGAPPGELARLAETYPFSLRLAFLAAVSPDDRPRWRAEMFRRGEGFAGMQAVFLIDPRPHGVRIADYLRRWLALEPVGCRLAPKELAGAWDEIIASL